MWSARTKGLDDPRALQQRHRRGTFVGRRDGIRLATVRQATVEAVIGADR
jgi:hypothetical protein